MYLDYSRSPTPPARQSRSIAAHLDTSSGPENSSLRGLATLPCHAWPRPRHQRHSRDPCDRTMLARSVGTAPKLFPKADPYARGPAILAPSQCQRSVWFLPLKKPLCRRKRRRTGRDSALLPAEPSLYRRAQRTFVSNPETLLERRVLREE